MPNSNKTTSIRAPLINDCKNLVVEQLTTHLAHMFDEAEPALLDFADMAETNQSQQRFVEAINAIKAARKQVESRFQEEITKGFREFLQGNPISYPSHISLPQPDGHLSIVDNHDLEKQVAIQKMVGRLHSENFHDLYAMGQRMAMLRGGKKLREEDLPASPVHIATCFEIAAENLELEPEILLIIYILFDKFVMQVCGALFHQINTLLIEAGIFPNLKFEVPTAKPSPQGLGTENRGQRERTPPSQTSATSTHGSPQEQQTATPRRSHNRGASGTIGTSVGEEIFQSIRSLMSTQRENSPEYQNHPEVSPTARPREMVQPQILINAIGSIQPSKEAPLLPQIENNSSQASVNIDAEVLQDIRQNLAKEQHQLFTHVDRNSIPVANLDTIDLVGMLFNQVLDEEGLPNIVKALIGHLHTPYLKIAVIDHSFLIDKSHIARRLLDLMVEAGLKWVDEKDLRKGVYYLLQESITQILTEFKDDIGIFSEIFDQLRQQLDELEEKARAVEARTQEAARGRERLESARSRAHHIIEKRLGSNELPPPLGRFLYHAWLDKLVIMMLRDPDIEMSPEWKDALAVVDLVIWGCQAKRKPQRRTPLKERLGEITNRISDGLSSLGAYHQPDCDDLIELLHAYADMRHDLPAETEEALPVVPQSKRGEETAIRLNRKESEILEQLKKIKFGTWFQLKDTSGHLHRIKLSWFSPVTKKCMFVNQKGIQAKVLPIEELARQMCNGSAQITTQPDTSFVDRALNSIKNILTKALGSKSPA